MSRRFGKVSEEEIEEGFFYPSDLVNTKTTIPLRVSDEQWIYPPLFISPSGDSCILLLGYLKDSNVVAKFLHSDIFYTVIHLPANSKTCINLYFLIPCQIMGCY